MNVSMTDPLEAKTFPNRTDDQISFRCRAVSCVIISPIRFVRPKIDVGLAALSVETLINRAIGTLRPALMTFLVPKMFVK